MEVVWVVVVAVLVAAVAGQEGCQTTDGKSGQCVGIQQCPEMLALLRRVQAGTAEPGAFSILRRSICDLSNNRPRVCCAITTPSTGGGASLLPSYCGVSSLVDRVFGGENAPLLAWPWIAVLSRRGPAGSSYSCGGVLISQRYVLTAAHCVHPTSGAHVEYVRLGEHDLFKNPDCENHICAPDPQDIQVEEVKIHEQYDPSRPTCSLCNDIALIRLARPVTLNRLHVTPICMPGDLNRDLGIKNGNYTAKYGWVAGWGTIKRVDVKQPDILQEALLPISYKYCDVTSYPNKDMVLCAGGEGVDSCRGDSGGPLTLNNPGNTRTFILGLVSKGPAVCGASRTQGIYTSVNFYMPWILNNLRP